MKRRSALAPSMLWFLTSLILMGSASEAVGHGRSVSYSSWALNGASAEVTVRIKLLELSRLGPQALPPGVLRGGPAAQSRDLPAAFFPRDLVLVADGAVCPSDPVAQRRPDDPGWARYQWRIDCPPEAADLSIRTRILLDVAPSHLHFARVNMADPSTGIRERVLSEASPIFSLRRASADDSAEHLVGSRFRDYFELGVLHILSGWDHLAFVFGLLLLANRFGEVARLVTGFTIAHSLTLALAVQGLVDPQAAAVEAVIAFSVALVAIEKGWLDHGRPLAIPIAVLGGLLVLAIFVGLGLARFPLITVAGLVIFTSCYFALVSQSVSAWLRVLLTFAFGLVHGLGFAGILVEMTLPADRLVPALLGFNLGVEAGQIGVVLVLWPLLVWGSRWISKPRVRFASALSTASLCGLGLYWLVERISAP